MPGVAQPISNIVPVSVVIGASAAQPQNTSTLLALTSSAQIDLITRIASFSSLSAVGSFFGTGGAEYAIASLWFGQLPSPGPMFFGRWAETAAAGQLLCSPLTAAQQAITNFSGIADGTFHIGVDGAGAVSVTGVVLTGVLNLNAVAAAINAEFTTLALGVSCIWNGNNFVFTSASTGALSAVSFLTAGTGGTDISGLLGGLAVTGNGCYVSPGQAAETALAAVNLFDANFGQTWYALTIAGAADADHEAIGPAVQAMSNKHFYGVTTQEAGVLVAASTTDIAYILSQASLTRTAVQYSSTNPYAIVSALARILSVNYAATGSVLTLKFQGEPGVTGENLTTPQRDALLAKNCNVYINYQGGATIIEPGTTCSANQFIDTIIGVDNLAIDIQINIFNLLLQATTKIPQDDGGMHQFVASAQQTCLGYVTDGLGAPGTWTEPGFGSLNTGDFMESGFYVYAPPVASQLPSARAARMAVPLQIAFKLAGAVQTVPVLISVNP